MLKSVRMGFLFPLHKIDVAFMSAEGRRNQEAIELYNKLRKQPLRETEHTASELKIANSFFEKIKEYRKKTEQGFEPSKLFMVWRVGSTLNRPIWEKQAIIDLGLAGHKVKYAIVMNTPSNNKKLWDIKHLIRLKPIIFPDGMPEDNGDYTGTFLKQTGELVVASRLKVKPEDLEPDLEFKRKTLDPRTIREELRVDWNKGYPKMY